ncbi:hypothetical protein AC578_10452 [Pseudocercospora eumusae]|uniref:Uncharacterized protein n=1 Tax=Pseudocercospora eumusae TaxID=321146 RepID=A0A139H2C4_9PEZI|nr:hypothetical protein AC578_10452 [Pseudocercospora eumusae]
MATGDRITGLREQIMANAAIAFPDTIHKNGGEYQTHIHSAGEIVEVVVAEYGDLVPTKRACLVFRTGIQPTYAAWGERSDTVERALESLLQALGKKLVEDHEDLPDFRDPAGLFM